ncbi:MAG: glycosyltransferase [Muribaculaceae bacterium]|nr:glycosyltransferase [Muribaculaceae bacterium]
MKPYFSVIVSIYNKKKLIDKGINLLLNQSFKNFEIIIINDGSSDGTYRILEYLKNYDFRIRIFHQENKGLGNARNRGIKLSKGEYLCFFDIDDFVPYNWLQHIYDIIIKKNPEVLIYSYNEINLKIRTKNSFVFNDIEFKSNVEIKNGYVENLSGIKFNNGFVWNKVYKREFIINNKIFFPELRIQQDEVFNHEVYKNAESIITTSDILYDYYIYEKNNSRKNFIPNRIDIFIEILISFFNLCKFWDLKNDKLEEYIYLRFFSNIIYNRNPYNFNQKKLFFKELINSNELTGAVLYIKKNIYNQLTFVDKIYLNSILNKSFKIFCGLEFYLWSLNILKSIYHKINLKFI